MYAQTLVTIEDPELRFRLVNVLRIKPQDCIILFDDADSSLDTRHDQMLVKLLSELKKKYTMIIVSHRPSILQLCDRNYMLEGGDLIMLPWLSGQRKQESVNPQSLSA